ncbi:hypothetical protein H0H81_012732 [Sphagnurus paluster]|uniref:Uncharacterized protein n=1 Tax=Sphagnurus paluster TaxID=117069 RepID=A0A9P7GN00_9AGAR|nr:hypothetical protein H0H81_012732 [Sphagnurus paluster]
MKSVVNAFAQFQLALSFALTAVNVEAKFVWLFASFAIASWVVSTIFFFVFRTLDKCESELNAIGQGERRGFQYENAEDITGVRKV